MLSRTWQKSAVLVTPKTLLRFLSEEKKRKNFKNNKTILCAVLVKPVISSVVPNNNQKSFQVFQKLNSHKCIKFKRACRNLLGMVSLLVALKTLHPWKQLIPAMLQCPSPTWLKICLFVEQQRLMLVPGLSLKTEHTFFSVMCHFWHIVNYVIVKTRLLSLKQRSRVV